ncbi:MAG: hypothetical protein IJ416_02305 [Ruminiclostridium sp.]|nr:hypothetical protein [Ruminiclostridium sp.]
MDNKNTALNQNVDLISTKGLDEMQREQAFKIAFNCFKYFYWGNVVIATLLVIGSIFFDENLTLVYTLSFIGIAIILFSSVLYVIFAIKSTAKASLNPGFVINSSKPSRIILMSVMGFGYTIVAVNRYLDGESIAQLFSGIFMAILYISHIITYFLARKSLKLMKTETEEEE